MKYKSDLYSENGTDSQMNLRKSSNTNKGDRSVGFSGGASDKVEKGKKEPKEEKVEATPTVDLENQ